MGHEFLGPSMRVSGGKGCGLGGSHKETELRLGLPGLESPERPEKAVTGLGFALGAKRVFLDTVGGSSNWAFPGGNGSEVEFGKNGGLVRLGNGMKGNDCGGLAAKGGSMEKEQDSPAANERGMVPTSKAQVVGWPPVRNYRNRKNTMTSNPSKNDANTEEKQMPGFDRFVFVKVSMDGAPYLRKINLKTYCNYKELSGALKKMFSCFTIGQCGSHVLTPSKDGHKEGHLADGSEYVLTYEDKDGDWMLVGDVPWKMFIETCRKLRIMKGSDAIGLAPPVTDKCESRN